MGDCKIAFRSTRRNAEAVVSLRRVFAAGRGKVESRKSRAKVIKSWGEPGLRAQQQVMGKASRTPATESGTPVPPEKGLTPSSGLHSYLVVVAISN